MWVCANVIMWFTSVQAGQMRCCSIPSIGKRCPHQYSYLMVTWGLFHWAVCLTNHLHLVKVKKEWSYTSTPPHTFMACTWTTFPSHILQQNSPHSLTSGSTIQSTVSISTVFNLQESENSNLMWYDTASFCNIPAHLILQHQCCENLKSCLYICVHNYILHV